MAKVGQITKQAIIVFDEVELHYLHDTLQNGSEYECAEHEALRHGIFDVVHSILYPKLELK